ncbi:MAG: hypothetical protein H7836_12920 [Magnetococcus sp. YQC-3]
MSDSPFDAPDFSSKYILFAIFVLFWIYFGRDRGDYYILKPVFEIFIVGLIYSSGQGIIWWSRYSLPHVSVNGHHGSIFGKPRIERDIKGVEWAIFSTGFSLWPVPFHGKLSTLVVPANQIKKCGMGYIGLTYVRKFNAMTLPVRVNDLLLKHKSEYNLHNVYFGFASEEFKSEDPDVSALLSQLESLRLQVNVYRSIIEGKNDVVSEEMEKAKELTGMKSNLVDSIKAIIKKQEPND